MSHQLDICLTLLTLENAARWTFPISSLTVNTPSPDTQCDPLLTAISSIPLYRDTFAVRISCLRWIIQYLVRLIDIPSPQSYLTAFQIHIRHNDQCYRGKPCPRIFQLHDHIRLHKCPRFSSGHPIAMGDSQ